MSDIGERYTKLMTPAFVDGLENPRELSQGTSSFWERLIAAQVAIRDGLQLPDWEHSGLPLKVFGPDDQIGQRPLTPHEYAERLMVFAFDDALVPIQCAETYVTDNNIHIPLSQLLRDSKTNLLKPARLADDDKGHLYAVIKHRASEEMKNIADAFGDPKYEGPPIELTAQSRGVPLLDWNPAIRDWIEDRLYPDRGCPAQRFAVNIDGKNMSLINYFWDQLTEVLYP